LERVKFVEHGMAIARASRADRGSFIELVEPDAPNDSRIYLSSVGPTTMWRGRQWTTSRRTVRRGKNCHCTCRRHVDLLAEHGRGVDGGGVGAYLNQKTAAPYVGHAAAVSVAATTAQPLFGDVAADVPDAVSLDLCLHAAHAASWTGAQVVRTVLEHPILDSIGFRRVGSVREVTTDLLAVNYHAYRQILSESERWRPPRNKRPRFRRASTRVGLR
jgi:hypothetical protein